MIVHLSAVWADSKEKEGQVAISQELMKSLVIVSHYLYTYFLLFLKLCKQLTDVQQNAGIKISER